MTVRDSLLSCEHTLWCGLGAGSAGSLIRSLSSVFAANLVGRRSSPPVVGALSLLHRLASGLGAKNSTKGADRSRPALDPAFKRVMTFLFLGTKGGSNRIRIVRLLRQEALNANKIGERLSLDYKTVQHHLEVLEDNQVVVPSSPKGTYGSMYFLSQYFEKQLDLLEEMWVESGGK